MSVLTLRFAGPLQSWGISSLFETRNTERVPSKSGVTGFLGAAIGILRDDKEHDKRLAELSALKIAVREDKTGELLSDFHTVKSSKSAYLTRRHYLMDAVFLVCIEGSDAYLQMLKNAVENPEFPLFLGRRSCVPAGKIVLGINDGSLMQTLKTTPCLYNYNAAAPKKLFYCMDSNPDNKNSFFQNDFPLSFRYEQRRYRNRLVESGFVEFPQNSADEKNNEDYEDFDPISATEVLN